MTLAPHLYKLLQLRSISATVEFGGEVIRGKNRKLLAFASWGAVAQQFASVVPSTEEQPLDDLPVAALARAHLSLHESVHTTG